ncbi:MAG TPA: hypothetical protein VGC77_22465 [Rhodopseudomonas sp.]|uniref:hypothetical protein n=1 Tax=Rhodopseudomonas sp. TaxID=1078 RepID=UPI002ED7C6C7
MSLGTRTLLATLLLALAGSWQAQAHAEGIDTEHLFGFMIGSDVGTPGERELQSQSTARASRSGSSYRSGSQQFELEFVPARNFRVELGSSFVAHRIQGVAGFDDRREAAWQGASVDLRYRLLDREAAPFGMSVALENHADRVDETSGARVQAFGSELTLALDRELIPDRLLAAVNLSYQPEWTRPIDAGRTERSSGLGVAAALMAQLRPGLLLGGEARYLRNYDGIGLDQLTGQAWFVGPTAYFKLSETSRLTVAWSLQVWGHGAGSNAALDLINFDRHQARLTYGVNF